MSFKQLRSSLVVGLRRKIEVHYSFIKVEINISKNQSMKYGRTLLKIA